MYTVKYQIQLFTILINHDKAQFCPKLGWGDSSLARVLGSIERSWVQVLVMLNVPWKNAFLTQ